MEYDDYVHVLAEQDPELARQVAGFNTLENVLGWMRQRGLGLETLDVVTQDEFSHDVVMPLAPDGRHIAFGIT
jgi:hypothetical protein